MAPPKDRENVALYLSEQLPPGAPTWDLRARFCSDIRMLRIGFLCISYENVYKSGTMLPSTGPICAPPIGGHGPPALRAPPWRSWSLAAPLGAPMVMVWKACQYFSGSLECARRFFRKLSEGARSKLSRLRPHPEPPCFGGPHRRGGNLRSHP